MKARFYFLIIIFLAVQIQSQSLIVFQTGTHIEVQTGANIFADSVIINGTFSGGGTINGLPIPVELTFFHASITDKIVTLVWQTATETNNRGFEIQRSLQIDGGQAVVSGQHTENASADSWTLNAESWTKIGFVDGAGTTTDQQNYLYADENLSNGKYSYRLKQIDFDGSFSYSNEIEIVVNIPYVFSLSQNYPNPFNPSTKIKFTIANVETGHTSTSLSNHAPSLQVLLKVFDILGNEVATLVNEEKTSGVYEVEWNALKVSSGIYYYRITAGAFVETKRMIYLK